MDWLDSLKSAAGGVYDDIVSTGQGYISDSWENTKNDFLGTGSNSEKKATEEVKAAIPGAQDSTVAGNGVGAKPKRPINWSAVGVAVAVLALVVR